jgi:phytoene dehydrogenase-like protein
LRGYFDAVMAIGRELDRLPPKLGWRELATAPLRFPHLLRYRTWTLQRLYDHLRMPPRMQAVLAGQAGDYLLPPAEVSLLLHVALVRGYDRGAYYPERHFQHLVGSIADRIRGQAGCALLLDTPIDHIDVRGDRVVGVRARDGRTFTADRYVSNVDPKRTAGMLGRKRLPDAWARHLRYTYSSGNLTLYLGVEGLDLRQHGFGSHNVWHYPHDDLNAIYRRQLVDLDFDEPWLFMSTPTLHTDAPGLCPPGHQILELATSAPHAHFRKLRDTRSPPLQRGEEAAARPHDPDRRGALRAGAARPPGDAGDGHAGDQRALLRRAGRQRLRRGLDPGACRPGPRRPGHAVRQPVAGQRDRGLPERRRHGARGARSLPSAGATLTRARRGVVMSRG